MTADDRTAIRKTARVAGGLYLSLVPLGIISFVYVPSLVLVPAMPQPLPATSLHRKGYSGWVRPVTC
jgi:hypothetical protein